MNLTDEEIRIKVAEAMGWKWNASTDVGGKAFPECWTHDDHGFAWQVADLPSYPLDLNSCAEFEAHAYKHEPAGWFGRYKDELAEQCSKLEYPYWNPICAPARQRCLAYLKTKGLIP